MDDRDFAERLYSTLDNIKREVKGLKPVIFLPMQILTTRYQLGVDVDRREQEESFEEDFKDLLGRLDLGRSEEVKNNLIETLRAEKMGSMGTGCTPERGRPDDHSRRIRSPSKNQKEVSTVPLVEDKDGRLKHKSLSDVDDEDREVPDPSKMHHW